MDEYELAARCAVVKWFEREEPLSRKIRETTIDNDVARNWLSYWMLSRTVPIRNRDQLCHFLNDIKRLILQKNGYEQGFIESLAQCGLNIGITNGRPTSLVSKFAFTCCPDAYVPYDLRARTALRTTFNEAIVAHQYTSYISAINRKKQDFYGILKSSDFLYQGKLMKQSLFEMRAFDKYLMLKGGFSRDRMEASVNGKFESKR